MNAIETVAPKSHSLRISQEPNPVPIDALLEHQDNRCERLSLY